MNLLRVFPLLALSLTLGGCISLFPKQDAAQLYRFDGDVRAANTATSSETFGVFRVRTGFPQEVAGDRILGMVDNEAAYVAEARWVAPAAVLFDSAVAHAFDANNGPARLVTRGEIGRARYGLRLDVRRFETVYDQGRQAAPQVSVEVRAVMTGLKDRSLTGEKLFTAHVRAGDNRVGAIVAAFDTAVGQVLGEIVAWTNGGGAG